MSALNATIYSSSRVSFAMGRDGNLPIFFGKRHSITRTPHLAIFLSSALIVAMAIALPIEQVAASADIMFLLLFMMVCYSVISLRERRPDLDRQFKMPWVPVLPWIGILLCIALSLTLIELGPIPWLITIAWIIFGLLLYFSYSARQQEAMAQAQRPIILEEVVAMRERSIMVPVADVGQARSLGELGTTLAVMAGAELFALHVVRVPQALSISEGRVFLQRGRDVLDVAIEEGRQRDVPVRTMIRLGHNIAQTIMATARQRDANLILLGWPGYSHSPDVAFGSIIDLVGQDPPADVAVVRFRRSWVAPQRIVIPARGGGPNIQLAFELARSIAGFFAREENGGLQIPIQALFINTTGTKSRSLERFRSQIEPIAAALGIQVDIQRHHAEDVAGGILEMTGQKDLLLMGATEQGLFEQRLFGTIP